MNCLEYKLFKILEPQMMDIWNFAFGVDSVPDIRNCNTMYERLNDYWKNLIYNESYDIWSNGYKLICESFGNTHFMFDTDIPEQDDLVYRLIELIIVKKDSKLIKKLINNLSIEKLKEDF